MSNLVLEAMIIFQKGIVEEVEKEVTATAHEGTVSTEGINVMKRLTFTHPDGGHAFGLGERRGFTLLGSSDFKLQWQGVCITRLVMVASGE